MFVLFAFFCHLNSFAREAVVANAFLKASEIYQQYHEEDYYFLRPEIKVILNLFKTQRIKPEMLKRFSSVESVKLVATDPFDHWPKRNKKIMSRTKVAIHAFKIDVLDTEDWLGDDIYAYFFVTDGTVPTGKVTDLYKNISNRQSFFLNPNDRWIYPIGSTYGRAPNQHIIIDYGIIESDGDDVKELHKLSEIIVDMALAVYSTLEPGNSSILLRLRREIKTLSALIINLNNDDRLFTSSFAYKAEEIDNMLRDKTFIEFKRKHGSKYFFDKWKYQIHFRIIRDNL